MVKHGKGKMSGVNTVGRKTKKSDYWSAWMAYNEFAKFWNGEKKMFTVYKVVRPAEYPITPNTFLSAVVGSNTISNKAKPFELTYRLHQETRALPNSLGVFVFTDLHSARSFSNIRSDKTQVVKGWSSEEPKKIQRISTFDQIRNLMAFFEKRSWFRRVKYAADAATDSKNRRTRRTVARLFRDRAPEGTHVVPSVTLTEVV